MDAETIGIGGTPFVDEWEAAQRAFEANRPFLWYLSWHDSARSLVPGEATWYLNDRDAQGPAARAEHSPLVLSLRDAFYHQAGLAIHGVVKPSPYTTLHVRRGDALTQCNSSVGRWEYTPLAREKPCSPARPPSRRLGHRRLDTHALPPAQSRGVRAVLPRQRRLAGHQ